MRPERLSLPPAMSINWTRFVRNSQMHFRSSSVSAPVLAGKLVVAQATSKLASSEVVLLVSGGSYERREKKQISYFNTTIYLVCREDPHDRYK